MRVILPPVLSLEFMLNRRYPLQSASVTLICEARHAGNATPTTDKASINGTVSATSVTLGILNSPVPRPICVPKKSNSARVTIRPNGVPPLSFRPRFLRRGI